MTNSDQSDFPIGARTSVSLEELLNSSNAWPTPVESTKERRTYYIEVDDNTHWALVSIAAKQKLHQEDFVENLLVGFVEEWRAVHEATS
jgi:hypothetical protein